MHELQHLGGGIAPWNLQQYSFTEQNGKLSGKEIKTGKTFEVIFFHFHGVKFYENNIVSLSHSLYFINEDVIAIFYKPYIKSLLALKEKIIIFDANGANGVSPQQPLNFILILKFYLADLSTSLTSIFGVIIVVML